MAQPHVSLSASPSPRSSSWLSNSWLIVQRIVIAAFLLAPAMRGVAQAAVAPAAPPEGSNWQHVQALPAGQSIHVKARHGSASCALKSVDADSLTCLHGKDIVFQRSEIRSITIPRRVLSSAIGGAVGAGVGTAVGAGLAPSLWSKRSKGVAVGIAIFAPVGILVGASTNFAHSTVYEAP